MNGHRWTSCAISLLVVAGVQSALAGEPTPQGPSGPIATVRDFGAVGDATADDTAAIQRAVDAAIGDIRFPRGVFRISRTIVVDLEKTGPTSLVGDGTARIVMAGPGPAFRLIGTHAGTASPHTVEANVWQRQRMPIVAGLEIVGGHDQAVGIEATGTMKLVVTRVTVREALHGIHLVNRNRNVIVSDCHLYKNRGMGLYLDRVNLHQINVGNCHISYNMAGGIVVRAGDVRNLHVHGCDIEGNMPSKTMPDADAPPTANVLIDSGGDAGSIAEVAITGCTIQHTCEARDSANIRFLGLGTRQQNWGHLTIANNVLSDVQINIDIRGARGVSIVGNTFWTGVQHNLRVVQSSNVVIGPNVMDRNPAYRDQEMANDGVVLRDCTDTTMTGLHINGVRRAKAGLVLENCRGLNVYGCTILDCERAGVLMKNVTASRVSDCLIRYDGPKAGWRPLIMLGDCGDTIVEGLPGGAKGGSHHLE